MTEEEKAKAAGEAINLKTLAKYQQISWTLKVEGDVFKVPELKSKGINVAGSFQAALIVKQATSKSTASQTTINLEDALPSKEYRVIAAILKLEDSTPKEMTPLKVPTPSGAPRELGMETGKNPLVYFLQIPGFQTQSQLVVSNENLFDVKLSLSLAYGPKH